MIWITKGYIKTIFYIKIVFFSIFLKIEFLLYFLRKSAIFMKEISYFGSKNDFFGFKARLETPYTFMRYLFDYVGLKGHN